ncbi:hypothetical protein [Nocardia sp. NBC_00403]|uniref:hypothetical protein n=1 Tax=Nocardia sp. NBC_00403 TaxID=2975990 RepID=UPI002E212C9D
MTAGVAAVAMTYLSAKMARRRSGPTGHNYTWGSSVAVLVAGAAIYVGVLLLFGWFSVREARHGSQRVRRYASPGAVLQARYLSDGLEVTTALGTTAYQFAKIGKISVGTHTVALTGAGRWLVLPRELVPAEAISFLERSIAAG